MENTLYVVVKVGRKSHRKTKIQNNLGLEAAQRLVKSYPNSTRSIVVYYSHENYYGNNNRRNS